MKRKILIIFLLMGALFIYTTIPANAVLFSFDNITANNDGDAAIGEAQLFVDVTDQDGYEDLTADLVLFTFYNSGPEASSITDVYFGGDGLVSIDDIINMTGVSFSEFAIPSHLPGVNDLIINFSADSTTPVALNGVDPEESLGILFNLESGFTLDGILAALYSEELLLGIKVQAFDSGESETFLNNSAPVPEPATMLLFGCGLIGLAVVGRKNFNREI